MTETEQKELAIFRDLEQLIRENKDTLLTEVVPDGCGCNKRED
jgi:hypothetical protein